MKGNLLTIVLPAHNEEANVDSIYREIRQLRLSLSFPVEIVFVDDASTDGTAERIREITVADPLVRLIRFTRNFGQQAALLAGLQAARGAAVITMDCDLQHPPEYIPRMIEEWESGSRIVQMVRRETAGAGIFKRATSRLFYLLIGLISESPLVPGAADYQLLDRRVVDYILRFGDRQPFLRGTVGWLGFRSCQIQYDAPARTAGVTSYSTGKMLGLFLDAVISLSSKPLRVAFHLGSLAAALCLLYTLVALVAFIAGKSVPGWTSLIVTILFLGAVQLVFIGIIGEYVARIYDHTRRLPPFVIEEDTCAEDRQHREHRA